MKQIIHLALVLTFICAISSALLAAVYRLTKDPIEQAVAQRTGNAVAAVMPQDLKQPPQPVTVNGETFYVIKEQGKLLAAAVIGSSNNGYGGTFTLMVGLTADGTVTDFQKIEANETPGLGTKVFEEEFRRQIRHRPFDANWRVDKDGGEIEAVASATISSRAVLECINDAITKFKRAAGELAL